MADPLAGPDLPPLGEEEPLFARGLDGRLIVARAPTVADLDRTVKLKVDGSAEFVVPKAVPATDAQGNIMYKADDTPVVRATTIFDAARSAPALLAGLTPPPGCPVRIPVLCHRDHMAPVAVCRVCAVQIVKPDPRDPSKPPRVERKVLPACQHPVENGMEVHTMWSPDSKYRTQVRAAVQGLFELLSADHFHPEQDAALGGRASKCQNELAGDTRGADQHDAGNAADLQAVLRANWAAFPQDAAGPREQAARDRVAGGVSRFAPKPFRKGLVDGLQPVAPGHPPAPFLVDHNSCILCDRCVRACGEVKPFRVIGRSGKGSATRIAFDLRPLPMADSSCRQCGECMTACPTGAITFAQRVLDSAPDRLDKLLTHDGRLPPAEAVSADDLLGRELFSRLPKPFLEWNRGSVRKRVVRPGDVLADEGEFGTAAFVLPGRKDTGAVVAVCKTGAAPVSLAAADPAVQAAVKKLPKKYGAVVRLLTADPGALHGETSIVNQARRFASMVAVRAGEVLEVDRNVLHMLLRDRTIRAVMDTKYAGRAIREFLPKGVSKSKLFSAVTARTGDKDWVGRFVAHLLAAISDSYQPGTATMAELNALAADELAAAGKVVTTRLPTSFLTRIQLVRANPGQVICRAGESANNFYLIRTGFVGVEVATPTGPLALKPLTTGECFGEVALLTALWPGVEDAVGRPVARGVRTATCTALDHAELVLVPGAVFDDFLDAPANKAVRQAMRDSVAEDLKRFSK